jgi:hypothetical protein
MQAKFEFYEPRQAWMRIQRYGKSGKKRKRKGKKDIDGDIEIFGTGSGRQGSGSSSSSNEIIKAP